MFIQLLANVYDEVVESQKRDLCLGEVITKTDIER